MTEERGVEEREDKKDVVNIFENVLITFPGDIY